jgi:hypothetical protein
VLDAIAAYDEAWNAPDSVTRARLLEQSLAPDAELVDPTVGFIRGRDAIGERIAGFTGRFPGGRVTISGDVDEHHGFARYAWTITDADGATLGRGIDIVERGDGGRLRRVIMFVD